MKLKDILIKLLSFLRLAFSENGHPSSKRILAGFIITVVLFCTSWSVVKCGMTDNNKSIIEFEIVTAGALLGVSNITSIWKNNNEPTITYPTGGTVPNITNPDEEDA